MTYRHATVFFRVCLAWVLLAPLVSHSAGVTYTYDDQGRLKIVEYSAGKATTYSLDAAGNRVNIVNQVNVGDVTPPTTPALLTAVSPNSTTVNLSWPVSTDNVAVASYRVERCTGTGCTGFVEIGSTATLSFSDTTVAGSIAYQYRVRARDAANNNSSYSNVQGITTPDTIPPTVPTGLTGTAPTSTSVSLSWTASSDSGGSGLAGYRVERCTGAGCSNFVEIAAPTTAAFTDTTIASTVIYQYRVRARDAANNYSVGYSNVFSISAADAISPTVPTGLVLGAPAPTVSQVNLSWTASTDNVAVTGYRIYRGGSLLGTSATTSYSDNTVAGSTAYTYTVRAYDAAGNQSGDSNVLNVTTPAPPPAIPAPPSPISKGGNSVSWTAKPGATYYQLRIAVGLTVVYSGTATSFNTALPACEMEGYNAVACSANGCSAPTANIRVSGPRNVTCP